MAAILSPGGDDLNSHTWGIIDQEKNIYMYIYMYIYVYIYNIY